jgi:hypothetical protein
MVFTGLRIQAVVVWMKMAASRSSETLVSYLITTWRNNQEDLDLDSGNFTVTGSCEHDKESLVSLKGGTFLDHPRYNELFMKDSAPYMSI